MNLAEFRQDGNAQRRFYIFGGLLALGLVWLLFGGSVRSALRVAGKPSPNRARIADQARAVAPKVTAAPAPAPPPPALTPEQVTEAKLSALAGTWGGGMPVAGVGMCEIRLEVKPGAEKTGFAGYSVMSCANVQRFRPGQRSNPQNANKALLDATPVSAILSGAMENGSIELHQDKAFGADAAGCNIISVSLTPFGELMGVSWKEGPANWKEKPESSCADGQVIMHRIRAL